MRTGRSPDPLVAGRPTILVSIDHTLWHRLGISRLTYVRALKNAGGRVRRHHYGALVVHANEEKTARSRSVQHLFAGVRGLVLAGGGDIDPRLYEAVHESALAVQPRRDSFELALLEEARERRLPVFAICRGAQLLNVALGGTLRDLRSEATTRRRHHSWRGHAVRLDEESRLARILDTTYLPRVVTLHGQAVDEPGAGVHVVGRSDDGVVEAIEVEGDEWTIGVQWHPELSLSGSHRRLFQALVEAARRVDPEGMAP